MNDSLISSRRKSMKGDTAAIGGELTLLHLAYEGFERLQEALRIHLFVQARGVSACLPPRIGCVPLDDEASDVWDGFVQQEIPFLIRRKALVLSLGPRRAAKMIADRKAKLAAEAEDGQDEKQKQKNAETESTEIPDEASDADKESHLKTTSDPNAAGYKKNEGPTPSWLVSSSEREHNSGGASRQFMKYPLPCSRKTSPIRKTPKKPAVETPAIPPPAPPRRTRLRAATVNRKPEAIFFKDEEEADRKRRLLRELMMKKGDGDENEEEGEEEGGETEGNNLSFSAALNSVANPLLHARGNSEGQEGSTEDEIKVNNSAPARILPKRREGGGGGPPLPSPALLASIAHFSFSSAGGDAGNKDANTNSGTTATAGAPSADAAASPSKLKTAMKPFSPLLASDAMLKPRPQKLSFAPTDNQHDTSPSPSSYARIVEPLGSPRTAMTNSISHLGGGGGGDGSAGGATRRKQTTFGGITTHYPHRSSAFSSSEQPNASFSGAFLSSSFAMVNPLQSNDLLAACPSNDSFNNIAGGPPKYNLDNISSVFEPISPPTVPDTSSAPLDEVDVADEDCEDNLLFLASEASFGISLLSIPRLDCIDKDTFVYVISRALFRARRHIPEGLITLEGCREVAAEAFRSVDHNGLREGTCRWEDISELLLEETTTRYAAVSYRQSSAESYDRFMLKDWPSLPPTAIKALSVQGSPQLLVVDHIPRSGTATGRATHLLHGKDTYSAAVAVNEIMGSYLTIHSENDLSVKKYIVRNGPEDIKSVEVALWVSNTHIGVGGGSHSASSPSLLLFGSDLGIHVFDYGPNAVKPKLRRTHIIHSRTTQTCAMLLDKDKLLCGNRDGAISCYNLPTLFRTGRGDAVGKIIVSDDVNQPAIPADPYSSARRAHSMAIGGNNGSPLVLAATIRAAASSTAAEGGAGGVGVGSGTYVSPYAGNDSDDDDNWVGADGVYHDTNSLIGRMKTARRAAGALARVHHTDLEDGVMGQVQAHRHGQPVTSLAQSSPISLISGSMDGYVAIIHIPTWSITRRFLAEPAGVCGLAYSPLHQAMVTWTYDVVIKLWAGFSGTNPLTFRDSVNPHTRSITNVAILSDAPHVITMDGDGVVKTWDLRSTVCLHTKKLIPEHEFQTHSTALCHSVLYQPRYRRVLAVSKDFHHAVAQFVSGASFLTAHGSESIKFLVIAKSSGMIISATISETKIWDGARGGLRWGSAGHDQQPHKKLEGRFAKQSRENENATHSNTSPPRNQSPTRRAGVVRSKSPKNSAKGDESTGPNRSHQSSSSPPRGEKVGSSANPFTMSFVANLASCATHDKTAMCVDDDGNKIAFATVSGTVHEQRISTGRIVANHTTFSPQYDKTKPDPEAVAVVGIFYSSATRELVAVCANGSVRYFGEGAESPYPTRVTSIWSEEEVKAVRRQLHAQAMERERAELAFENEAADGLDSLAPLLRQQRAGGVAGSRRSSQSTHAKRNLNASPQRFASPPSSLNASTTSDRPPISPAGPDPIIHCVFSKATQTIAVATQSGRIRVIRAASHTGASTHEFAVPSEITIMRFLDPYPCLAVADYSGGISFFLVRPAVLLAVFECFGTTNGGGNVPLATAGGSAPNGQASRPQNPMVRRPTECNTNNKNTNANRATTLNTDIDTDIRNSASPSVSLSSAAADHRFDNLFQWAMRTQYEYGHATAMALDPASGHFYVSDHNGYVCVYDLTPFIFAYHLQPLCGSDSIDVAREMARIIRESTSMAFETPEETDEDEPEGSSDESKQDDDCSEKDDNKRSENVAWRRRIKSSRNSSLAGSASKISDGVPRRSTSSQFDGENNKSARSYKASSAGGRHSIVSGWGNSSLKNTTSRARRQPLRRWWVATASAVSSTRSLPARETDALSHQSVSSPRRVGSPVLARATSGFFGSTASMWGKSRSTGNGRDSVSKSNSNSNTYEPSASSFPLTLTQQLFIAAMCTMRRHFSDAVEAINTSVCDETVEDITGVSPTPRRGAAEIKTASTTYPSSTAISPSRHALYQKIKSSAMPMPDPLIIEPAKIASARERRRSMAASGILSSPSSALFPSPSSATPSPFSPVPSPSSQPNEEISSNNNTYKKSFSSQKKKATVTISPQTLSVEVDDDDDQAMSSPPVFTSVATPHLNTSAFSTTTMKEKGGENSNDERRGGGASFAENNNMTGPLSSSTTLKPSSAQTAALISVSDECLGFVREIQNEVSRVGLEVVKTGRRAFRQPKKHRNRSLIQNNDNKGRKVRRQQTKKAADSKKGAEENEGEEATSYFSSSSSSFSSSSSSLSSDTSVTSATDADIGIVSGDGYNKEEGTKKKAPYSSVGGRAQTRHPSRGHNRYYQRLMLAAPAATTNYTNTNTVAGGADGFVSLEKLLEKCCVSSPFYNVAYNAAGGEYKTLLHQSGGIHDVRTGRDSSSSDSETENDEVDNDDENEDVVDEHKKDKDHRKEVRWGSDLPQQAARVEYRSYKAKGKRRGEGLVSLLPKSDRENSSDSSGPSPDFATLRRRRQSSTNAVKRALFALTSLREREGESENNENEKGPLGDENTKKKGKKRRNEQQRSSPEKQSSSFVAPDTTAASSSFDPKRLVDDSRYVQNCLAPFIRRIRHLDHIPKPEEVFKGVLKSVSSSSGGGGAAGDTLSFIFAGGGAASNQAMSGGGTAVALNVGSGGATSPNYAVATNTSGGALVGVSGQEAAEIAMMINNGGGGADGGSGGMPTSGTNKRTRAGGLLSTGNDVNKAGTAKSGNGKNIQSVMSNAAANAALLASSVTTHIDLLGNGMVVMANNEGGLSLWMRGLVSKITDINCGAIYTAVVTELSRQLIASYKARRGVDMRKSDQSEIEKEAKNVLRGLGAAGSYMDVSSATLTHKLLYGDKYKREWLVSHGAEWCAAYRIEEETKRRKQKQEQEQMSLSSSASESGNESRRATPPRLSVTPPLSSTQQMHTATSTARRESNEKKGPASVPNKVGFYFPPPSSSTSHQSDKNNAESSSHAQKSTLAFTSFGTNGVTKDKKTLHSPPHDKNSFKNLNVMRGDAHSSNSDEQNREDEEGGSGLGGGHYTTYTFPRSLSNSAVCSVGSVTRPPSVRTSFRFDFVNSKAETNEELTYDDVLIPKEDATAPKLTALCLENESRQEISERQLQLEQNRKSDNRSAAHIASSANKPFNINSPSSPAAAVAVSSSSGAQLRGPSPSVAFVFDDDEHRLTGGNHNQGKGGKEKVRGGGGGGGLGREEFARASTVTRGDAWGEDEDDGGDRGNKGQRPSSCYSNSDYLVFGEGRDTFTGARQSSVSARASFTASRASHRMSSSYPTTLVSSPPPRGVMSARNRNSSARFVGGKGRGDGLVALKVRLGSTGCLPPPLQASPRPSSSSLAAPAGRPSRGTPSRTTVTGIVLTPSSPRPSYFPSQSLKSLTENNTSSLLTFDEGEKIDWTVFSSSPQQQEQHQQTEDKEGIIAATAKSGHATPPLVPVKPPSHPTSPPPHRPSHTDNNSIKVPKNGNGNHEGFFVENMSSIVAGAGYLPCVIGTTPRSRTSNSFFEVLTPRRPQALIDDDAVGDGEDHLSPPKGTLSGTGDRSGTHESIKQKRESTAAGGRGGSLKMRGGGSSSSPRSLSSTLLASSPPIAILAEERKRQTLGASNNYGFDVAVARQGKKSYH